GGEAGGPADGVDACPIVARPRAVMVILVGKSVFEHAKTPLRESTTCLRGLATAPPRSFCWCPRLPPPLLLRGKLSSNTILPSEEHNMPKGFRYCAAALVLLVAAIAPAPPHFFPTPHPHHTSPPP